MPSAHFSNRWSLAAWAFLLLAASVGCSPQTRHDVLTFFFTGVPPLEGGNGSAGKQPRKEKTAAESRQTGKRRSAAAGSATASDAQQPERPRYYSHQVWLENDCAACHEGSAVFGFSAGRQQPGVTVGERIFHGGGGMPGALLRPREKVCIGCHTDKTAIRAIKDHLWLHNSTARGQCLACHDAHQSSHPAILRKPADQICLPCHHGEKLALIPMHRGLTEPCLTCHNPHMGKDRSLLNSDYQEDKQPARRKP